MATIRDKVKDIVRDTLISNGIASKYRLATVSSLNNDGSATVILDGNAQTVHPLYPVVKGQSVALVFSTDGTISAIPTRAYPETVQTIHPPFFTGGGPFNFAWLEQNTSTSPASYAIRFQKMGSNIIYRWVVVPGLANPSFVVPNVMAFSPNNKFFAYGSEMNWDTSTQGALPPGLLTKIAVVEIGHKFSEGALIQNFPQGFLLNATEPTIIYVAGLDLVETAFPPQFANQALRYQVTSIYVSDTGQLYWTELLRIIDTGTNTHRAILINFCTVANGIRTVLGSLQSFDQFGGTLQGSGLGGAFDTQTNEFCSVLEGSVVIDTTRSYVEACKPLAYPTINPDTMSHSVENFFRLNSSFGLGTPIILLSYDDGDSGDINIASQGFDNGSSGRALNQNSFNASSVFFGQTVTRNFFLVVESIQSGLFLRYKVFGSGANPPNNSNFNPGSIIFGEKSIQQALIIQDPANANAMSLYKVVVDTPNLTITAQLTPIAPATTAQLVVTPNPVDSGLTKYNLRTANYDNYTISTVPGNQFPGAVGIPTVI